MRYAQDDPAFADFVNALDSVNASADASPGFIWRLVSTDSESESLRAFEASGWLVNMSVWESLGDLRNFIKSPLHLSIMRRRTEWFQKAEEAYMCLWWVPEGHEPDFGEAMERLEHLRSHGPSGRAFNFTEPCAPPSCNMRLKQTE